MDNENKLVDEKAAALCKKYFAGTMYEHVGTPEFLKLCEAQWNAQHAPRDFDNWALNFLKKSLAKN